MKFYRIADESEKVVNDVMSGIINSAKVKIQGFKGLVEINYSQSIKAFSGVECDFNTFDECDKFEVEKPTFLIINKQVIEGVESFELVNAKKDLLKQSAKNNTFIECKYNGMKALYNAQTKECIVLFEGVLYIA